MRSDKAPKGVAAWRPRARVAVEAYLRRRSFPRLMLTFILLATGGIGLACSFGFLRLGLEAMWLRYPLAVGVAYGGFLVMVRGWVGLEQRRFDGSDPVLREALSEAHEGEGAVGTKVRSQGSSWLDWLDVPDLDGLELGDGCLPVVVVAAVLGVLAVLLWAVVGAPALLAEVLVDAFLTGVLYRRLGRAVEGNWLGTAIRRTWGLVVLTALLMGVAGWGLGVMAPGAVSIGPALSQWW